MVVNFEFLGGEPIENVITCMNFNIDKVVFFGYHNVIEEQRANTEYFLKKYCDVSSIVFHPVSQNDMQSTLNTMRKEVQREREQKNQIYFDITGGESLILVAFGMLSREFETPMHMYDIPSNKLIELDEGAKARISKDVTRKELKLTLDMLIRMRGGIINETLHKGIKEVTDPDFTQDVEHIYAVAKEHWDYWNPFSEFLRSALTPDEPDSLQVRKNIHEVLHALSESRTILKTMTKLNELVDKLAASGILQNVEHANGLYRFRFKNKEIKDCLWEGGSILELHTCQKEKQHSDECRVGVHLDWDGIIHEKPGSDVLNEIDVLSLKDNVPTFISCKSGKMRPQQALHALYELETVTRRFGGKYAKKVLVSVNTLGDVYIERAKEMGIELR